MSLQGPFSGATFADDGTVGTISLANATNAIVSDNIYVTWVLLLAQLGHYLKATNFSFTVPPDATIQGIVVEVEKSTTVGTSITDQSVKIIKGGVISGTEQASAAQWPTSDAYTTYGSSTDLWGLSWTPADINGSTFGVAIAPNCGLAATAQVDHIRISVSWAGSNRPSSLGRISAGTGISCNEKN